MPSKSLLLPHRTAYEVMKAKIEQNGQYLVNNEIGAAAANKKNIRAAQSFIWSQIALTPNSSSYLMNIKDGVPNLGSSGMLPGEIRLKEQDVFFTYAVGFYLLAYANTDGNIHDGGNKLLTFPPSYLYGAAPSLVPGLYTMDGIWTMGRMNIKVNGEITTPNWDLGQHLHVPQTQVSSPYTGTPAQDQIDLGEDGLVICEPNWIFNGSNNNEITIQYPNNFSDIQFGGWKWHLVLKFQGFLAQNCSSIMNNAPLVSK